MRVVLSRKLFLPGGAVALLGARLDGIEEVVGSNPIGSTKTSQFLGVISATIFATSRPCRQFVTRTGRDVSDRFCDPRVRIMLGLFFI